MDQPTLSPSWNRVARLTPMLGPRVQVHRQVFRRRPWFVVQDPINNSFYRLNPVLYQFVGLLDGKRTVDDAWRAILDRFGDDAPTQGEIIGLLSQLNGANLLRMDVPPDAESLLARQRRRRLQHWSGQARSILFIRFPLFSPDGLIRWLLPLARPLLSRWGLVLWTAWIVYALWRFLPHVGRFAGDINSVLAPANWAWLIVLFLITKIIHELGHGLVCRRFGGAVTDLGILMLVLFPAPYVDTSSSWSFPSRWQRLLVASAGMMFELAVAAGAAVIWLAADPGTLTRQLAYNTVFLASVSTIVFNGNPLLRFDGYYMLSDVLGVANLYQRSTKQIQWYVQRYLFGSRHVPPPAVEIAERVWLTVYGVLSTAYRFVVLFGIFFLIIGKFYMLGLLIGLWSLAMWVLLPAGKFVRWLAASPSLAGRRGRAVAATSAAVTVGVLLIGMLPLKDHRRTHGVIESQHTLQLTTQMDGFVTQVLDDPDQRVSAGDIILVADNPDLRTQWQVLDKQRQILEQELATAAARGPGAVDMARRRMDLHDQESEEMDRLIESLTLRSGQDGVVVDVRLKDLVGVYLRRGEVIGRVIDPARLRVTAMVGQLQNAPLFAGRQIESVALRTAGSLDRQLLSSIIRTFEAAHNKLPHPALGYGAGGPLATDAGDESGATLLRPHFELWLELPPIDRHGRAVTPPMPGQRVHVRFTLQHRRPLLGQWFRRLHQLIRHRVRV